MVGNLDSFRWTCPALDKQVWKDESQTGLWPRHAGWGQVERFEREAQNISQNQRGHWRCPLLQVYSAVYSPRLGFCSLNILLSAPFQALHLSFCPCRRSLLHRCRFVFVASPFVHFWKSREIGSWCCVALRNQRTSLKWDNIWSHSFVHVLTCIMFIYLVCHYCFGAACNHSSCRL